MHDCRRHPGSSQGISNSTVALTTSYRHLVHNGLNLIVSFFVFCISEVFDGLIVVVTMSIDMLLLIFIVLCLLLGLLK